METWRKVTTRSQVSVNRTNDPMVLPNCCSYRPETLPRLPSYPFRVKKKNKFTLSSDCTCRLSGERSLPLGYLFILCSRPFQGDTFVVLLIIIAPAYSRVRYRSSNFSRSSLYSSSVLVQLGLCRIYSETTLLVVT